MPSEPHPQSAQKIAPETGAMTDVIALFKAAQGREPALAAAQLTGALRMVPGKRALMEGSFAGRRAVFRFYLDAPAKHATRDWAELERTRPYMTEGDLQAHEGLYTSPEIGLVITSFAEGQPLMERIWQAVKPARPAMMPPAARWLRKYTRPTEATAPARLEGWLDRAARRAARQPFEALRPVEAAILAELHRIAAPMAGKPWRMAVCHGDFHPNNLLADGPRLTAIDIGGSAKLPIYKDMARFLAHMGRRGLDLSGSSRFGADMAGIEAFAEAFALDETERGIWLPFMLGIEALMRVEAEFFRKSRLRRSKAFYEALLADLQAIPL
ncbi:MAG: phosphotransferase [Roseovarius sp.]